MNHSHHNACFRLCGVALAVAFLLSGVSGCATIGAGPDGKLGSNAKIGAGIGAVALGVGLAILGGNPLYAIPGALTGAVMGASFGYGQDLQENTERLRREPALTPYHKDRAAEFLNTGKDGETRSWRDPSSGGLRVMTIMRSETSAKKYCRISTMEGTMENMEYKSVQFTSCRAPTGEWVL